MILECFFCRTDFIFKAQQLKADKRFSSIPVVLSSAMNDLQQIARKAGADAYIQKPLDLDELEELILFLLHLKKQSE
ncbi:hypothetical protein SAMN05661044_01516 [Olivibacter domesticus]|uniref:Response regulatory domain-containing protein n=1 Tax=Olivibacter domesticus TaxID=407022 RepID=A0A1H7KZQ7_OLID1|nr:hypothetical protein SAMN05661044_01516 [Olivibacter domesticus]